MVAFFARFPAARFPAWRPNEIEFHFQLKDIGGTVKQIQ